MALETKIHLWSGDGSVAEDLAFVGFVHQVEAYFNRFGHLPKRGDIARQDFDSKDQDSVVYIDNIDYSGIQDDFFSIGISLSIYEPIR